MSTERTTATCDRIAARYAARASYSLERELMRFTQMVPPGNLVLDVGCGPGHYTRALESRGLRVVGLDLSAGLLHQARAAGTRRAPRATRSFSSHTQASLPIPHSANR